MRERRCRYSEEPFSQGTRYKFVDNIPYLKHSKVDILLHACVAGGSSYDLLETLCYVNGQGGEALLVNLCGEVSFSCGEILLWGYRVLGR